MRLGECLIEAGAITEAQLGVALREQARAGGRLGVNLVELGFLTEAMLTKVLAAQLHLPRLGESGLDRVPRSVLDLLGIDIVSRFSVCPVKLDGKRLHLAMSDPLDKNAIAAVAEHTSLEIRPMIAPDGVVRHALQKHYGVIPKPKFISMRQAEGEGATSGEADPSQGTAGVGHAPVFDPYGANSDDARLGSVDDRQPAAPSVKASPAKGPPPVPSSRLEAGTLIERLAAVQALDDVADVLVRFLMQDYTRAALFLLRGDQLMTWRTSGHTDMGRAGTMLQAAAWPGLLDAIKRGEPVAPASAELLAAFRPFFGETGGTGCVLLPFSRNGKPVGCALATGARTDDASRVATYRSFATKVDLALQVIALRRQISA